MTKLDALLDEYEESHRHPVNILIHWIAEPLAIFALMALAYSVSLFGVALLWPFLAVMLIYFAALSLRVALAFMLVVVLFVVLIGWIAAAGEMPTWQWALPLFMICWFALLGGHKIEGRVPSVFQNPNLIFVGPAWLMRRIFRRIGISKL
jgi:uncharacterized membrane protein YGL010W